MQEYLYHENSKNLKRAIAIDISAQKEAQSNLIDAYSQLASAHKREAEQSQKLQETLSELNSYKNSLEAKVEVELEKNRELHQTMAQQSKMASMGEMFASLSHQWKQPLSVISAILSKAELDLMLEKVDEKSSLEMVTSVQDQVSHMAQTMVDFKEFFKPDREAKQFVIKESIEEVLALFTKDFSQDSIEISLLEIGSTDIKTDGFINEFKHVMLNILNNARDAIVETNAGNRTILVTISVKDHLNRVEIIDEAGGIDPKIIHQVFEPYVSSKGKKGTGIGLYMSKQIIVELFGGKIAVQNSSKGAIFTISLPVGKHTSA